MTQNAPNSYSGYNFLHDLLLTFLALSSLFSESNRTSDLPV